jgi:transposase-like protein
MAGQGRVGRQGFWRSAIRRQEENGLPVARFCRREGLHPVTFYSWRRKLPQERVAARIGAGAEGKPRQESPSLVPVRLLEERESAAVEVASPSGLVLRVRAGRWCEGTHDGSVQGSRSWFQAFL